MTARSIDSILRSFGFFFVTGHGVSSALAEVYDASRTFFDLSDSLKQLYASKSNQFLGYRGLNTLRASTSDKTGHRDLKETFTIGREPSPNQSQEDLSYVSPNVWPDGLPVLKRALVQYYEVTQSLALELGEIFAIALGLPESYFASKLDKQLSWLVSINYPALAPEAVAPGQMRFAPHRDRGFFTILSNSGAGLEVQNSAGEWQSISVAPSTLVVNTGSMLSYLTGGRWTSALHRVRYPETEASRRQTVVFFVNPNPDLVLNPVLGGDGTQGKEHPTVAQFLSSMLDLYR